MGLDRCELVKYSGLSDGTHTDHGLYRKLFAIAPVLGLYSSSEEYTILVPHHVLIQGHQDLLLFSVIFIAEELDGV
jgi:hypothetical protein